MKKIIFTFLFSSFVFCEFHNEGGSGNWVANEFKSRAYRILAQECRINQNVEFVNTFEKVISKIDIKTLDKDKITPEVSQYPYATIAVDRDKKITLSLNKPKWSLFFDLDISSYELIHELLKTAYSESENKTAYSQLNISWLLQTKENIANRDKYFNSGFAFRDGAISWFVRPNFGAEVDVDNTCKKEMPQTKNGENEVPTVENVMNSLKVIQAAFIKQKWLSLNNYTVILSEGERSDKKVYFDILEGKVTPFDSKRRAPQNGYALLCVNYP
jgi:hypothetical protein